MESKFDPYHKWLGIPPKDQPPNHYRLLALELFESDPEVIDAAANRQMAYIQQRATGKHAAVSQRLLNEISAARLCLLNSEKKAAYDAKLAIPTASPAPAAETNGVERLLSEEREIILQQVQHAHDERNYEKVLEIAEAESAFGDDPRLRQLLQSARFCLDEIQRLSRELHLAWRVKNTRRATKIADEILAIQPSNLAANEAIRWARSQEGRATTPSTLANGTKTKEEPLLRKYLALTAMVFVVAVLGGSLIVRQQLASVRKSSPAVERTLPRDTNNEATERQRAAVKGQVDAASNHLTNQGIAAQPENHRSAQQHRDGIAGTATAIPTGTVLVTSFEPSFVSSNEFYVVGGSAKNYGGSVVDGKVGKALRVSNGGHVIISGVFPTSGQPRTLALWLRSATTWKGGHAVVCGMNGKNRPFGIMTANGKWRFYDNNGGLSSDIPVDTSWHHHCLVYDDLDLTYFIDGKQVASAAKTLNTAPGPLVLGQCCNGKSDFDGEIDELALFDRPLNETEVRQLFESGVAGTALATRVTPPVSQPLPSSQKPDRRNGIVKPGNVALASNGTIVQGDFANPSAINNGRVNERWNERAKAKLNHPITLVFPEAYQLRRIRIKLTDGKQWNEYYQYTLEASSDGESYEVLADRREGQWRGWQTIECSPRPVKSIRLTGTEDHPNHTGIRIYEIEAYCPTN